MSWPPPDPDRIPRQLRRPEQDEMYASENSTSWSPEQIEAFRQRQREDLKRYENTNLPVIRRKPFHEREAVEEHRSQSRSQSRDFTSSAPLGVGEEVWRDSAGDRLDDFGLDEEIEFYDE